VSRVLAGLLCLTAAVSAQLPVVGDINFYGLRTVTPERILAALHLQSGDPIPGSKGDMEDRIAQIPGVVLARVEAVCCDGRAAALFIGVEEKGAPHTAFRSPPAGDATLPEELMDTYQKFLTAVGRAAGRGAASEDLTAGHSLMADPQARALQERFLVYAAAHLGTLRTVLHNGSEPGQRAVAAAVIGYAPDKAAVVDDLQYALQDPDESVRANALRALNAVAVLASKKPEAGLRIAPTWTIELLHSVVLSDRVQAVKVLLTLTDRPAPEVLGEIHDRALPDLVEMASWKTPRYALPPFLLLGRVVGLTDQEVQQAWQKGDRDSVIGKAQQRAPRKRLQ
jgi:HEAT repeats